MHVTALPETPRQVQVQEQRRCRGSDPQVVVVVVVVVAAFKWNRQPERHGQRDKAPNVKMLKPLFGHHHPVEERRTYR